MTGKLFGENTYDPKFIITQILALQTIFYTFLSSSTFLMNHILGLNNNLTQLFHPDIYDFNDSYSLSTLLSMIITAPITVFSMVIIVERASKCLDFGSTIFGIHLFIVTCTQQFPLALFWWVFNTGALVIIVLLS